MFYIVVLAPNFAHLIMSSANRLNKQLSIIVSLENVV